MRNVRNGFLAVLCVLLTVSIAELQATSYMPGYPHCDDPAPGRVEVAAWGQIDCSGEARWDECLAACELCYPGAVTGYGVHDCQNTPPSFFWLECTCQTIEG
jgi:hypothetical protein